MAPSSCGQRGHQRHSTKIFTAGSARPPEPVRENIARMKRGGSGGSDTCSFPPHDDPAELGSLAGWWLSPDIPWHISRFTRRTSRWTAPNPSGLDPSRRDIGLAAGLRHVYPGNVGAMAAKKRLPPLRGMSWTVRLYGGRTVSRTATARLRRGRGRSVAL
jgi:hypothetical protein